TLESASRSTFARIFSGNTGIDPYTTAASDVYQDLFAEGSFTGKGLYDVDAFEAALAGRVPDNALLSHDLFEGLYARCGLVTDIELLDDYPSHYDTYAKRQHRWTRGDWQIARWLMPRVPDAAGQSVRNRLPLIARWKIFDNLRRSLVAPAIVLWLIAAWLFFPGTPVLWTLFVVLVLAFPVYAHVTTSLLMHPRGIPWSSHFWSVWGDVLNNTAQVALLFVSLAHQSYLMLDAIARTLYRKLVSHKHLLEWMTAAQTESGGRHDLSAFLRFMWSAELITALALLLLFWLRPAALLVAAPFLLMWAVSPFVVYLASRPRALTHISLDADERRAARLIARRTWRFFETFVGEDDHWLPPDNYQEDPQPLIAHRTSPTNMGLLLLSTVSAYDFGYLPTLELVERLELTSATLSKLQKFRGHCFNWYDTRTLEPLAPQYISTVDSGNLAGHLLATKQAAVELPDRLLKDASALDGLSDTIAMMRDEVARLTAIRQRTEVVTVRQLREEIEACARLVAVRETQTLGAWTGLLHALLQHAEIIKDIVGALAQEHGSDNYEELRFWVNALEHQSRSHLRDLQTLAPWGNALAEH
ncbi:MAG TPA: hypothetical protein VGC64_01830, partial [Pyrinomonadaceae bacterium]